MNLLPFGKLPAAKPRAFVPQTIDLGDWPQIAPLFDQLECARRKLQIRRRTRTLAARLERTQRRAGRGILAPLHRHDLPHGQRGRGKGVSAFRGKRRAAAQAAPVRAGENLRRPSATRGIAGNWNAGLRHGANLQQRSAPEAGVPELRSLRPRREKSRRTVPARKCSARNRGGPALPAIPEIERLAHGQFSRRGKNARANGPLPRRTRPRAPAGGVGTRRQTAASGSGQVRRHFRQANQAARANREKRRLWELPRLRLPPARPV